MRELLKWEALKVWKKNSFWLFFVLIPIVSCALYTYNYYDSLAQIDLQKERLEEQLKAVQEDDQTEGSKVFEQETQKQLDSVTNPDDSAVLNDQLEYLDRVIQGTDYVTSLVMIGEENQIISRNILQLNRDRLGYMLQEKIAPQRPLTLALPQDYLANFTPNERESYYQLNYKDKNASGLLYVKNFFEHSWGFIFLIVVVFLLGGTVSNEQQKGHDHLAFMRLQGISFLKWSVAKRLVNWGYVLFLLVLWFVPMIVLSLFLGGIGQLNYPVMAYDVSDAALNYTWMTLGAYDLKALLLLTLMEWFLVECFTLAGVFIKNELQIWILSVGIILLGAVLPLHSFNLLSYVKIDQVVTGALNLERLHDYYSFEKSVLLLISAIVVLSISSLCLLKRRAIR